MNIVQEFVYYLVLNKFPDSISEKKCFTHLARSSDVKVSKLKCKLRTTQGREIPIWLKVSNLSKCMRTHIMKIMAEA
jgi:hypothetical protein